MPDAHQTIKYRSLLSAEKRFTFDTKKVRAMLVAWNIAADVRDFCKDYGIRCQEYKI